MRRVFLNWLVTFTLLVLAFELYSSSTVHFESSQIQSVSKEKDQNTKLNKLGIGNEEGNGTYWLNKDSCFL